MGTTITLKNIPDDIYDSLKRAAETHHRSINSEAIACLERALLPTRLTHHEHIVRAREIRESLKGNQYKAADIRKAIDEGRA